MLKITRPTLLVNENICRKNIQMMADKADKSGIELIPHYKTHQSKAIGEWFKDYGVKKITVSSVKMAEYFADAGWDNIFIAFPVNILEVDVISRLSQKVEITLLLSDISSIDLLSPLLKKQVNVRIEVDTGANRSGVKPENQAILDGMIDRIQCSEHLNLIGLYSHAGHTYSCRSKKEISTISTKALDELVKLKKLTGLPISYGDTPGCSVNDDFSELSSIHPGNFVFYDIMQSQIGSCSFGDIGIAIAAPIVSKKADTLEFIIHSGGVHLSKDSITEEGARSFGRIVEIEKDNWSTPLAECNVSALSQEHGVIKVSESVFNKFNIGDVLGILPVHSCMTADCMGVYQRFDGTQLDHLKKEI